MQKERGHLPINVCVRVYLCNGFYHRKIFQFIAHGNNFMGMIYVSIDSTVCVFVGSLRTMAILRHTCLTKFSIFSLSPGNKQFLYYIFRIISVKEKKFEIFCSISKNN